MDTIPLTARLKEFGTWTEQTSSSGKRYYYNSATNISQWEKPTEWKHAEKLRATAGLKNGNGNNGNHHSTLQQTPKTKPPIENEKVSSSLPSIRMPQHQQPQLHKHSTPTGSTSTPSSTPPTFRPGALPNLQQPFKRMPEKQNSQLANTPSTVKPPQQLCKVEIPKTLASSLCFTPSTSSTSTPLPLRNIPTSSSSAPQTVTVNSSTPSFPQQQQKRPLENFSSSAPESFCEEKYSKFWRADLSGSRRAMGFDSFAFEMRKSADRQAKQMAVIFALDKDIHSIKTLERTALLRTSLLKQRIEAVRQRTQELESKPQ
uniref:WW domain-containing protein n=2 Tax=Meloidogyne incognita group TaxID=654580 RepID=A0A914N1V4_MELIC